MSIIKAVATKLFRQTVKLLPIQKRNYNHIEGMHQSYDYTNEKFECMLCSDDLDGWDLRQIFNDMFCFDMVPDPKTIIAGLYACRRLNEYSVAVRFIEAMKDKCGDDVDEIYPYIIQEIGPTLCELGIDTPEGLCYDKPELWLLNVHE